MVVLIISISPTPKFNKNLLAFLILSSFYLVKLMRLTLECIYVYFNLIKLPSSASISFRI